MEWGVPGVGGTRGRGTVLAVSTHRTLRRLHRERQPAVGCGHEFHASQKSSEWCATGPSLIFVLSSFGPRLMHVPAYTLYNAHVGHMKMYFAQPLPLPPLLVCPSGDPALLRSSSLILVIPSALRAGCSSRPGCIVGPGTHRLQGQARCSREGLLFFFWVIAMNKNIPLPCEQVPTPFFSTVP